jgi:hypothetical protein
VAKTTLRVAACAAALFVTVIPVSAQWVHYPTPGTPRTADGKADLTARAPKTADGKPDLSGIWKVPNGKYLQNLAVDEGEAPMLPWAEAIYKERKGNLAKGRPSESCLPHAVPDGQTVASSPFKMVQTPGFIIMLHEEFNHYRQIFTDGRPLPVDPQPAWFGYSVGKWEGDTLVVDSTGFNDLSWLDDPGHPHTEALHIIERFRRTDFGHLENRVTIDDPKTYTKPWSATIHFDLLPDTELIEAICDNNKDVEHAVGK